MPEQLGAERPGGRTARTRAAVHDAVRELLREPGVELTIPAVAARSGVHATTIYRRWGSIESLLLDIAVEDVEEQSPIPVTGDLEKDLTAYISNLFRSIRERGQLAFFSALQSAAAQATTFEQVADLTEPRLAAFQAMLDAAGVTRIDGLRLMEIIIPPAYFWAQLGAPLDPETDTARFVELALLAARG